MPNMPYTDDTLREEFKKKFGKDSELVQFLTAKYGTHIHHEQMINVIEDWWLSKFNDYQAYLIGQGEGMALEKRKGWEQLDEYQKIVAIAEIKAIEDYQAIIRGK